MRVRALLGLSLILGVTLPAGATPTGLNNIPTADVVPRRVLVLQQFTNGGVSQTFFYTGGFKYGVAKNLEVGLDARLGKSNADAPSLGVGGAGGAPSRPVAQVKYRLPLGSPDLAFGVGIANVGASTRTAGHPAYYGVFSSKLGDGHGHLGFLGQRASDNLFVGYDRKLGSRTTLRADLLRGLNGDGSAWLGSIGFITQLQSDFLVESWVSLPGQSSVRETFTLKFNYVLDLSRK
ncbi:MAG: hypothetical protein HY320_05030 [Armatimonadetes bacterium]|nr:hypothetical protein [Armatimonadota bacterium]